MYPRYCAHRDYGWSGFCLGLKMYFWNLILAVLRKLGANFHVKRRSEHDRVGTALSTSDTILAHRGSSENKLWGC